MRAGGLLRHRISGLRRYLPAAEFLFHIQFPGVNAQCGHIAVESFLTKTKQSKMLNYHQLSAKQAETTDTTTAESQEKRQAVQEELG